MQRPCRRAVACILAVLVLAAASVQADSGKTSVSIGKGLAIDTPPTQEPAPSSSKGSRMLGRKGGSNGNVVPVATGEDAGLPTGAARQADDSDAPLSFCRPGNGIICSDRDYTALLKAQPANIDLSNDNFAYTGFNPSATASLAGEAKLDLGARSGSTAAKANAQTDLKSNIGTEVLNANTDFTNTLANAAVKNNRLELLVPEKVTINVDKTDGSATVERRTNKPNFYYVLGQNFGFPNGLALAKDGVFGRRR